MVTRWMRGWAAIVAWMLSMLAVAPAGAAPAKGGDPVPPFRGKVTASNVNIRMSPGRDGTIVRVAREGESILVVGKEGGWFRIVPPENAWCWITASAVKKTEGASMVSRDTVLRQDARNNATEVGRIEKGAEIKILAEKVDWFKIQAPRWVPMYVHDEYIAFERAYDSKVDGEIEVAAVEPKAVGPKAGDGAAPKEKELTPEEKVAKANADREELRLRFQKIQDQYKKDLEQATRPAKPEKKAFDATGVVDTVGLFLNRPGTHVLVSGQQTVCYLKSADPGRIKLNEYYGKFVGVRGRSEAARGYEPLQVITVESIEALVKD